MAKAIEFHGQTVFISPLTFTVEERVGLKSDEDTDLYGEIRYFDKLILLERNTTALFKRATLLHEMLHGLFHVSGRADDEETVNALAYGLTQVFRDSPGLVAYIQNNEKLPKSITIGLLRYRVVVGDLDDDKSGHVVYGEQTIYLADTTVDIYCLITLLQLIVRAVFEHAGQNALHDDRGISDALAHRLISLFRDNPWLSFYGEK